MPTLVCAGQRELDTARAVGILLPYQLPRLLLSLLSHHEQGQIRALGDLKYVQEVVTHLYSKLLYEMGHYFLDTQYHFTGSMPGFFKL